MNQPSGPVPLAGLATRALEVVAPRASLFRRAPSAGKRAEELASIRVVAMRGLEHHAPGEVDELRQKGAALLVCGIDNALSAFSGKESDIERLLRLSKKKIESALHTFEAISK